MTPFEYVSVLLSMVVSLALAHLLIGITRIIKAGVSRWSTPMVGWIGFMIFLCIDYWFSVWAARNDPVWSLGFVCFLLLVSAVLFVSCWLIVPEIEIKEPADLATHHAAIRRRFLVGLFAYVVLGHLANLGLAGVQSTAVKNARPRADRIHRHGVGLRIVKGATRCRRGDVRSDYLVRIELHSGLVAGQVHSLAHN